MEAFGELQARFVDPPREFGMMPQWFWNDDLDESELLRQLREFHAKGCGGVMPHARIGLSRRVGYLTPEFFRLIRVVVQEAARLGMKVVLYDEGSYPSGSAQGQVVAENPSWANRVLMPLQRRLTGPAVGFWRSNTSRYLCDRLLGGVVGRETGPGALDPASLTRLESPDGELLCYAVPEGSWVLLAVWDVLSGATLRGVFAEEDDEHALAPAAADILNPEAVASFIRRTHAGYYEAVGEYFGSTVIGMFVDEPGLCGRGSRRGGPQARPYTHGFLADLQAGWDDDVLRWLPALWLDCGPRTGGFRAAYDRALLERQRRVFYSPIAQWCAAHGIALTGHPPRSDESSAQRLFHWPGQDMVWWYVAPGNATAMGGREWSGLEGEHSTAPKGAQSMALLDGRRRTTVEVLGAYGWQLSLDAVKWLLDWHLVRGINLFFPHACFYSIRGRRAYESEPDLGVHHPWWPYWGMVADYIRRLCWLFTDADEVCEAAVLCDIDALPWQAARALYEAQVPFLYVGADALEGAAVEGRWLRLGRGGIRVALVVVDPPGGVSAGVARRLAEFAAAGGTVISQWTPDALPALLCRRPEPRLLWRGPPELRVRLCHRGETMFCLVVNEGEDDIRGTLVIRDAGQVECWEPLTGRHWPLAVAVVSGGAQVEIRLERRECLVLACLPTAGSVAADPSSGASGAAPGVAGGLVMALDATWQAATVDGRALDIPAPGDWAQGSGYERFTGTISFRTEFSLTPAQAVAARFLDLGQVGDLAEVRLNGVPLGVRAWAPYILPLAAGLRRGGNTLEVRVTNSPANAYYGHQLPSGLLGPVRLRSAAAGEGPVSA
jgi:hypothetical protein